MKNYKGKYVRKKSGARLSTPGWANMSSNTSYLVEYQFDDGYLRLKDFLVLTHINEIELDTTKNENLRSIISKEIKNILREETVKPKRGYVYKDSDGKIWIYWGAVYDRHAIATPGKMPSRSIKLGVGRFFSKEDFQNATIKMKGMRGATPGMELNLDSLEFVATSLKQLRDSNSGIDIELISFLKDAIKNIGVSIKNNEFDLPSSVYSKLKLYGNSINEGTFNTINSIMFLKYYSKKLSSEEFKNKVNNISEETYSELKKSIAPKFLKLSELIRKDYKSKETELAHDLRYFNDEEKNFILHVFEKHNLIDKLDIIGNGVDIKLDGELEKDAEESANGPIVFWHHYITGTVVIDGKKYKERMYDTKNSKGWNYGS